MLQGPGGVQALGGALAALTAGGLSKSLLEQQQALQATGHAPFPAGIFGSALFGLPLAGELAADTIDALITPANAEGGAGPAGAATAPRVAAAAPPRQQCLFCSGLGSRGVCGQLRTAIVDGSSVVVHHQCALWSPGCYLPEGSQTYVNLETEARRARQRACSACGQRGASIPCSHPGCRHSYHLPCAMGAPNVLLESESFELWCPAHSDTDNSDEDYAHTAQRPRRQPGSGGGSKRARGPVEAQRPRTDWQKKDECTWLKVVPPWWCEHRTVHFATKVYAELFCSAGAALLVDPAGGEWQCLVHSEARNDLRPQYTLRGAFAELWESLGISAGDTLTFRRNPLTSCIELSRHGAPGAAKAEKGLDSEPSDLSAMAEAPGWRPARGTARQEASSERGQSQQGSHPNRWMELADGWAVKTVYKSTMAHQQCPIAGWLFKRLYGRLPGESDRAAMFDPDLEAEFRFDVSFISAANVHYITGRVFGAWMRESGLQAGEQIRMRRHGSFVLIQRVPADRKVRVDFTTKALAASRSASLAHTSEGAAVAGAPDSHGQELASPPTAEALEALEALVAAAGYAGTHGTPAIQAALAGGGGAAALAAGLPLPGVPTCMDGLPQGSVDLQALQLAMPPKRRRTGQGEASGAELLMRQQEQRLLGQPDASWRARPGAAAAPQPSLAGWHPSEPHVLMFQAVNQVLAGHQWTKEEQEELQRFRAKFAWLDGCGREMVYLTATQLQGDRSALLAFVGEVGRGILTQVLGMAPPGTTAAAHAAGANVPTAQLDGRGGSPFTVPPAIRAAPGAGTRASPFTVPPARLPAPQTQQQAEVSLMGAAVAVATAQPLGLSNAQLGLEAAASFNLDAFLQGDREVNDTPNPQCALGNLF